MHVGSIYESQSVAENIVCAQRNRFHGRWQYLFIESICNDPDVLQQNYRYKMMYSPDYKSTEADKVALHLKSYSHHHIWLLACKCKMGKCLKTELMCAFVREMRMYAGFE